MDPYEKCTRNFLSSQIPHVAGATFGFLVGAGISLYFEFFAGALFLFGGGVMALQGLLRIYAVIGGRLIADNTTFLVLPGKALISINAPEDVNFFRIVMLFEDPIEKFWGEIQVRNQATGELIKRVKLKRYLPSRVVSLPKWLWKGKRLYVWPRGDRPQASTAGANIRPFQEESRVCSGH